MESAEQAWTLSPAPLKTGRSGRCERPNPTLVALGRPHEQAHGSPMRGSTVRVVCLYQCQAATAQGTAKSTSTPVLSRRKYSSRDARGAAGLGNPKLSASRGGPGYVIVSGCDSGYRCACPLRMTFVAAGTETAWLDLTSPWSQHASSPKPARAFGRTTAKPRFAPSDCAPNSQGGEHAGHALPSSGWCSLLPGQRTPTKQSDVDLAVEVCRRRCIHALPI